MINENQQKVLKVIDNLINSVIANEISCVNESEIVKACENNTKMASKVKSTLVSSGYKVLPDINRDNLLEPKDEAELVEAVREHCIALEIYKTLKNKEFTKYSETCLSIIRRGEKAFQILYDKFSNMFYKEVSVKYLFDRWTEENRCELESLYNLALMNAIKDFDVEKRENSLSTFLTYKIKEVLQNYIERERPTVPRPHTFLTQRKKYMDFKQEKDYEEIDLKDLTELYNFKKHDEKAMKEKVLLFETYHTGFTSLDNSIQENDSSGASCEVCCLKDTLRSFDTNGHLIETQNVQEMLKVIFNYLSFEQYVIFILSSIIDLSFKDIANVLNKGKFWRVLLSKEKKYTPAMISAICNNAKTILASDKISKELEEARIYG